VLSPFERAKLSHLRLLTGGSNWKGVSSSYVRVASGVELGSDG
jgi:hypothetical protein